MIGSVVGSYRITEKIGEGGMGAVFKGVDLMLEREVAVKMLRPVVWKGSPRSNLPLVFRSRYTVQSGRTGSVAGSMLCRPDGRKRTCSHSRSQLPPRGSVSVIDDSAFDTGPADIDNQDVHEATPILKSLRQPSDYYLQSDFPVSTD